MQFLSSWRQREILPGPEMRVFRVKRVMVVGLVVISVVMFYQYLMWQLKLSGVIPIIGSSQHHAYVQFKQKFLPFGGGGGGDNKRCVSSDDSHENITTSKKRRPITSKNIDDIIAGTGLNVQDAFQSDLETVFSSEAIMISRLPQFTARIPAIVFHRNTLLAFCEARFEGVSDVGEMMIAMRRGRLLPDGSVSWENVQLIAGVRTFRTMNPSPIVDHKNDAIVLVFAAFPSSMSFHEMLGFSSFPLSKLYVMVSYDLGASWSDQADITSQTILRMHPNPVLLVPGPGHSIQMDCGRIIVPVNYFTHDENSARIPQMCPNCTNYNRMIYSDDGGLSWFVGQRSQFTQDGRSRPIYLNEVQAVEVDDNTLCLNSRTLRASHPRGISVSHDGGQTISPSYLAWELQEPGYKKDGKPMPGGGCAGSVIGFPSPFQDHHRSGFNHRWVLFSNPAHRSFRVNLSLRLSVDGCRSWSKPFRIFPAKAAYSDLAYFEAEVKGHWRRMVAVLFEGGYGSVVEGMKFKLLDLESILSGIRTATLLERSIER